jgi:hypothetical protein
VSNHDLACELAKSEGSFLHCRGFHILNNFTRDPTFLTGRSAGRKSGFLLNGERNLTNCLQGYADALLLLDIYVSSSKKVFNVSVARQITGCSVLTRSLLPWLAVHEMRDMQMVITSTVSVCKKDRCRNRS